VVAEAAQFRTNLETGNCRDPEQRYIENFEEITVSHDDVMRSYKARP
jgi:hypothetical protein